MTNKTKGRVMKAAAVILDVAAPLGATLTQFPIWVDRSAEATVSGLFVFMAVISCIPFWKQIKEYFKSPSAWVVWIVITAAALVVRSILDEIIIVGVLGCLSNIPGHFLYCWGNSVAEKPDKGGS